MEVVEIQVPGCKSASQRALILAALAEGESRLHGLSDGEDTTYLIQALQILGWELDENSTGEEGGRTVRIEGSQGPRTTSAKRVVIGEGGSTLRFLVPVLAAAPQDVVLEVAEGLRSRPQEAMQEVLEKCGASLTPEEDGFRLQSRAIEPGQPVAVPTELSSQFLSGFLMASGRQTRSWMPEGKLVSRGYLDLTLRMLRLFRGVDVLAAKELPWRQEAGFGRGLELTIPSDVSGVVFFAVAAVLQQVPVRVTTPWDTLHPDTAVLDFLQQADLLRVEGQVLHPKQPPSGISAQQPLEFDLEDSPDSGPALAVLAAGMMGGIRFLHPERLRHKESDRIHGMKRLAEACGGRMEATEGSVWIGCTGQADWTQPFNPTNDHRLAMAAGIATLGYPAATILEPECVAKSFPRFWEQLARLR